MRGWKAELELSYERRGGRTVLAQRRHDGPLVVQKPLYPEGDGVCHTIVVHPPGGIAGGDDLEIRASAGPNSHVLLTTPAAGKWYRTLGPWAQQRVALTAAPGARLEWLPQETILFDGARALIETCVDLAEGARFIGWDILCLGRTAYGERYASGEFRLHTRISRAGRLVWFERARVQGGDSFCTSRAGLGGHSVCATLLAVGAVDEALVKTCRAEQARDGSTGITLVQDVLVARYIGDSSENARSYFNRLWRHIRPAVAGRAAQEPRIWNT